MKLDYETDNQAENKEQLELATRDARLIIDVLEDEIDTEFHEARCDIECELSDLIATTAKEGKAYDRLLKQYYAADKYLDKALTAYTYLKQQIEKEVAKL